MTGRKTTYTLWISRMLHLIVHQWHIKVISVVIAVAIVYYYEVTSLELRVISVPLEVRINDAVSPVDIPPKIVRVNMRGEGEDVFAITSEDIHAILDLTEAEEAGQYATAITLERVGIAKTINPLELSTDPNQLTVEMDMTVNKEVEIILHTTATSPRGYAVTQTAIYPSVVSLSGPQKILQNIETIDTTAINIAQLTQSSTVRASLEFPHDYVTLTDEVAVSVQFEISELNIVNSFENIAIVARDIRDGLTSNIDEYRGAITLEGTQSAFSRLSVDTPLLFVGADEVITPGSYTLPVTAELPQDISGLTIVAYTPTEIDMMVTEQTSDGAR